MPGVRQEPVDGSTDALFVTVYARLKAMAARQLAGQRNVTPDTTELVHELYLRVGRRQLLQFALCPWPRPHHDTTRPGSSKPPMPHAAH